MLKKSLDKENLNPDKIETLDNSEVEAQKAVDTIKELSFKALLRAIQLLQEQCGISGAFIAPTASILEEITEEVKPIQGINLEIIEAPEPAQKTKLVMIIKRALGAKMLEVRKDGEMLSEMPDLKVLMNLISVGTVFVFPENKSPEEIKALQTEIQSQVKTVLVH